MLAQVFTPLREFQHDPTWIDRNWGIMLFLAAGALFAIFLIYYNWMTRPIR